MPFAAPFAATAGPALPPDLPAPAPPAAAPAAGGWGTTAMSLFAGGQAMLDKVSKTASNLFKVWGDTPEVPGPIRDECNAANVASAAGQLLVNGLVKTDNETIGRGVTSGAAPPPRGGAYTEGQPPRAGPDGVPVRLEDWASSYV